MELIRGRTLLQEIEQRNAILAEIVACIGALLADALAAAHKAGIIHRDIKPSNVLIAQGGRLLLADFGVARLETEDSLVTRTGSLLGTPAYMSPEQASGDTATAKSDLYSLGATLYQLSTGLLPYSGSPAKVMSQIAAGSLVPPVKRRASVGPDLSRVIEQLMASEVALRPEGAAVVSAELRRLAAAGGFGDATEELAAYFEDPEGFLEKRKSSVVSAIVSSAKKALADSKLPRAMALADRASLLAPEDPAVKTLVESVTAGAGASARRRMFAVAGVGVLAAGAGMAGVLVLRGGGSATPDAAPIAIVDAEAARDAEPDAVVGVTNVDALPPDAVIPTIADAMPAPLDAARKPPIDAREATARDAAPMVYFDAPETPIDAAPQVSIDAPPPSGDGTLIVVNDTWCDVIVDGQLRGQTSGNRFVIKLPPGHHVVQCKQGQAGPVWRKDVDLEAGKQFTVQDGMLKPVAVTFGVAANVDGRDFQRGDRAELKARQYRFKLPSGGEGWLIVPQTAQCTVRQTTSGLACDP
jgi:serine/threonine-protein kinase